MDTLWKINPEDLKNLTKELQKLGHVISDPNMQLHRAKRYRQFTIDRLRAGGLGLQPLLALTKAVNGDHVPEYISGTLVEHMGVKPIGKNEAEAGYWESNTEYVPNRGREPITYARLAILTHTGFRVRLATDKFNRVAAWFRKEHGIQLRRQTEMEGSDEHYLTWPPRPFMIESFHEYVNSGEDVRACDEFIDKMLNSPIDTSVGSAARKVAKDKEEVD